MRISRYNNFNALKYNNLHNQNNTISFNNTNVKLSKSLSRESLDKINNAHLCVFKAQIPKVVEQMNFKTKGTFSMVKQLFEHKFQILSEDITKLQNSFLDGYPNAKIDLPSPILGVSGEQYGCMFQLLRVPTEKEPRYIMVITSNNKNEKIELKNDELIANFDPKVNGMNLNEYVLTGLETQFLGIKTQEKLDKLEDDYKLRDSKVTEYIDNGLENIQEQVQNLKQQVDSNSQNIENIKKDIDGLEQRINSLRKELIQKTNALYKRIAEEDVEYPPLYVFDKGSLVEVCADTKNSPKIRYCRNWDYQLDEPFFRWLLCS